MDIIMIRHGETDDNVSKVFSRDDTRLTDNGKNQIKETRKKIEEFNYNTIYCSPLIRTKETRDLLGLQAIEQSDIREIDFGIFTGYKFEEISKKYPIESKLWMEDTLNYSIPEGESLENVYNRIRSFIDYIRKKDENVLLITHDCVIRCILCWIFDDMEYFYKFKIDNGSISIISIEDEYKYIKKLNF